MPDRPPAGDCIELEPGLRRVLAGNPSPMTHWGTNTYILGTGRVAIIDPGPALAPHLAALQNGLKRGELVSHILVTHPHNDHSPLARILSKITGAPIYGFGLPNAGRSDLMQRLADQTLDGGEGTDNNFSPDIILAEGDQLSGDNWQLRVLHTPGHFAGHLCFGWGSRLFTGDHVMGWASSLVSPPDGDMAAYRASLARLSRENWLRYYPAHGGPIDDPAKRLAFLIAHRHSRETAILAAMAKGIISLNELTDVVYADTPDALQPAAKRNLLAHLIDLAERNLVVASPTLGPKAKFTLR